MLYLLYYTCYISVLSFGFVNILLFFGTGWTRLLDETNGQHQHSSAVGLSQSKGYSVWHGQAGLLSGVYWCQTVVLFITAVINQIETILLENGLIWAHFLIKLFLFIKSVNLYFENGNKGFHFIYFFKPLGIMISLNKFFTVQNFFW